MEKNSQKEKKRVEVKGALGKMENDYR